MSIFFPGFLIFPNLFILTRLSLMLMLVTLKSWFLCLCDCAATELTTTEGLMLACQDSDLLTYTY